MIFSSFFMLFMAPHSVLIKFFLKLGLLLNCSTGKDLLIMHSQIYLNHCYIHTSWRRGLERWPHKRKVGCSNLNFPNFCQLSKRRWWVFFLPNSPYDIIIALSKCVYWLERVSQMSDVAHVPLVFSSPELKAQVSFSDHLSSVRRTTGPISTKLGIKHPWVKGIQVCSNDGPRPLPRGDNYEISKIHWQN